VRYSPKIFSTAYSGDPLHKNESRWREKVQKTDNMPLWVYLAFSSISTRKGALALIGVSVVFSFYCIPWSRFISGQGWVTKIFLIDDWSWFAMMVPVTCWYWISIKWLDKNSGWAGSVRD
jgi:hypothetical protein